MASSLLPERPLLVSPTLAATIGLEEAILLQAVADVLALGETENRPGWQGVEFLRLLDSDLQRMFPFWTAADIKRILASLQSLDLITMDREDGKPDVMWLAVNNANDSPKTAPTATTVRQTHVRGSGKTEPIPLNWRPDVTWINACKQHNIPEEFILAQVPEFVAYWRDRGHARYSWGNAFLRRVKDEWRREQARRGMYERQTEMSPDWEPSLDALEILVNAGVDPEFIEDAVPEFVLLWRDRGIVTSDWNTKFIAHIREQWGMFQSSFSFEGTPRPIEKDWQPSAECFLILELAEIDEEFAQKRLPEFVMYWLDTKQARRSWDKVFLQYIKQEWARQLKEQVSEVYTDGTNQYIDKTTREEVEAKLKQLADRSWAD